MRPAPRLGFSLIELLATLAVVAILTALVFAGLGRARAKAQTTQTIAHARQLAAALNQHAADHRGTWPAALVGPHRFWNRDVIYPALHDGRPASSWDALGDSVFTSPRAPAIGERDNPDAPAATSPGNQGFGYNAHLPPVDQSSTGAGSSTTTDAVVRPNLIQQPARTMVLMDCNAPRVWAPSFRVQYTTFVRNRHDARNVVLFADGRVDLVAHAAIPASHFATPEGSLFWRGF